MADHSISFHSELQEKSWKVTLIDTGLNTLKGARIKRLDNYKNKNKFKECQI